MEKYTYLTLFIFVSSALILGSCGGNSAPEPTDIPVPTDSPMPPSSGSGPSSLDLDDPDSFQEIPGDYSLTMDFRFEGEQADGMDASVTMLMLGTNQADPFAFNMDVTVSGVTDLGGVDHVIYAESEEQIFFWNEINGCVTLTANSDEGTLFTNVVDTGGFLTGVAHRAQPDETINGVPSYHFTLGPENLDSAHPDSMDINELTRGDIYIAQEGGYAVRLVLEGVGVSELLTSNSALVGDVFYQLDFEPAPDGVTVELPENCTEAGDTSVDFPVLENPQNAAAFAGFYNYQTDVDFDTAVDFYLTEMGANGWELQENNLVGGTSAMLFVMDDSTVSIVISKAGDGLLNIILAEEP